MLTLLTVGWAVGVVWNQWQAIAALQQQLWQQHQASQQQTQHLQALSSQLQAEWQTQQTRFHAQLQTELPTQLTATLNPRLAELNQQIQALQQGFQGELQQLAQLPEVVSNTRIPVGSVVAFAGKPMHLPPDWLLCDGQVLDKTLYPELYAVLGTLHGAGYNSQSLKTGDFNVPDYRGLFLRGVDWGRGLDPDRNTRQAAAVGGQSGDGVGSIQAGATALPHNPWILSLSGEHDHRNELFSNLVHANGREVAQVQATESKLWGDAPNLTGSKAMLLAGSHTHLVSGGDVETRPINVSVFWIIKAR